MCKLAAKGATIGGRPGVALTAEAATEGRLEGTNHGAGGGTDEGNLLPATTRCQRDEGGHGTSRGLALLIP